jgi:hypothetical protein
MNHRQSMLVIGVALMFSACRRAGPGPAAVAASVVPSACAAANGVGKLSLRLTVQPAVSETTEALVRLESETERSTVRVNATLGTTFELRPGTYRLSISLPGYSSAKQTVLIDCGTDRTLSVSLTKKR